MRAGRSDLNTLPLKVLVLNSFLPNRMYFWDSSNTDAINWRATYSYTIATNPIWITISNR